MTRYIVYVKSIFEYFLSNKKGALSAFPYNGFVFLGLPGGLPVGVYLCL